MDNSSQFLIENVKKNVDLCELHDDFRVAYEYYKELKKYLETENIKQLDIELYNRYYHYLIKLKFLSLNFVEDWQEIEDLLKNNFDAIYGFRYYDLWNKIKLNLTAVIDLDQRDVIKENLKKVLLNCQKKIFNLKKYGQNQNLPVTIADWLKDYNANLGIGKIDNLKRVQYLMKSEHIAKLDEEDKKKLKFLFDLYEKLKLSSNSREGFENDVPMVVDGKFVIFSDGEAEEIGPDIINLIKSIKIDNGNTVNSQQTKIQVADLQKNDILEQKALQEEKERENKIDELAAMANRFPVGSLERKAVEEELRKYR